jgi:hypothetical protein
MNQAPRSKNQAFLSRESAMKTSLLPVRFSIVFYLSSIIFSSAQSADLAKAGAYLEVMDPLNNFKRRNDSTNYVAVRGTKFKIVHISGDTCYVEFKRILRKDPTITNPVTQDRRYYITKSEINEATCRFTRGLYAAALSVPIKYRFKQSKSHTPSALSTNFDISSALGYSFRLGDVTATPVMFLGLATIALSDSSSSEIETRLGLTGGLGFAFAFSKNFQIALIGGADLLTGTVADQWPYQNKPWISVAVGYKFLDL